MKNIGNLSFGGEGHPANGFEQSRFAATVVTSDSDFVSCTKMMIKIFENPLLVGISFTELLEDDFHQERIVRLYVFANDAGSHASFRSQFAIDMGSAFHFGNTSFDWL